MPISRTVGFFDLGLGKVKTFQFRAGQGIKAKDESRGAFNFLAADNQACAGTTGQQRNPPVDAKDFQRLGGVGKEIRGHENQARAKRARTSWARKCSTQLRRPVFVEPFRPMGGDGKLRFHADTISTESVCGN